MATHTHIHMYAPTYQQAAAAAVAFVAIFGTRILWRGREVLEAPGAAVSSRPSMTDGAKRTAVPWRKQNRARDPQPPRNKLKSHGNPDGKVVASNPESFNYRRWLLTQHAEGILSAKRTCLGAYHLGDSAAQHGVADLVKPPGAQSGKYARHLKSALGLDNFENDFIFKANIMQHDRASRKNIRKLLPFLVPHRQVDEFWDDCETSDLDFLGLPIHAGLEIEEQRSPLSLVRLYVDGLDVGGKSRKL